MTKLSVLSLSLGCVVVSGCYTYHPVDRSAVAPGQEVQVRVTPEGVERVTRLLGEELGFETFRGKVEDGASLDSLYLSLSPGRIGGSPTRTDFTVLVPFPESEIREVGIHQLNKRRTLALVGGSAAIAAILVKTLFVTEVGKKGTDDSGGPDQALIPLIRIRW
jgi:hypothetical protein